MAQYRFGKFVEGSLDTATLAREWIKEAESKRGLLMATPVSQILSVLGEVAKLWREEGTYFERAVEVAVSEISFSPEMIRQTLRLVPSLCDPELLRQRLQIETGDHPTILDGFVQTGGLRGRIRWVPHGTLLQVAAGNVFVGCIDSLINGFLTKNVSIMKLSGKNQRFPLLFAESILEAEKNLASGPVLSDRFALAFWPGGSVEVEAVFKTSVNAIIAWGGQSMIDAYRMGLGRDTVLIEHGPKISFQILFKSYVDSLSASVVAWEGLADRIVLDMAIWDQSACSSPQNLIVEEGIDRTVLMKAIGAALDRFALPRGRLTDDEQVEILKERARAEFKELMQGGQLLESAEWLLCDDPDPELRSSPLNRTLIIKRFRDLEDLRAQIEPFAGYLQSVGYGAEGEERESLLRTLSPVGMFRFAPIGQMMTGTLGAPHDGRWPLAELTRMVVDENSQASVASTETLIEFVNRAIERVPAYRELYAAKPVRSLADFRPIASQFFADHSLTRSKELLRVDPDPGYIFSSGGTTGKPKFAYYSYSEFDAVAEMLAQGLKAQGVGPGTVCANLFVAGNLWSSFLAVDRALAQCGAVSLPIGGGAEPDLILQYLSDFAPEVVLGLPSFLVSVLNRATARGISLKVPAITYAGEHLNPQARSEFAARWGTTRFSSAGYASVDAGPIGYQCAHSLPGEHHLFSSYVHLEIIDDEAIVTSLVRENMPVIHLRTGDHVSWSQDSGELICPCGSSDRKFLLHGRKDGQLNLWACRFQLSEIEDALMAIGIKESTFRVIITEEASDVGLREILSIEIEGERGDWADLKRDFGIALHRTSKDVHATLTADYVASRVRLLGVEINSLPRVERTGKLIRVLDRRLSH